MSEDKLSHTTGESGQVLADRLQEAGDPWGELMALQLAPAPSREARRRSVARQRELISQLFGDLREVRVRWVDGFAMEVTIRSTAVPRRLLSHRACERLRVLEFAPFEGGAAVPDTLADPARSSLRTLELRPANRGVRRQARSEIGELAPFAEAFPNLETLVLDADDVYLDGFAFPALTTLEVRAVGLAPTDLAPLLVRPPARLQRLSVDFGDRFAQDDPSPLLELLEALPELRVLEVRGSGAAAALLRRVCSGSRGALEHVVLAESTLGDADASWLLAHVHRAGEWPSLDLTGNLIDPSHRDALEALPGVVVGPQYDPTAFAGFGEAALRALDFSELETR